MRTIEKMNILYITSYYLEDVCKQRNSYPYISQAGMNKANFMIELMKNCGHNVYVWSNAWTNSRSFRYYRGFQSAEDDHVFYSNIVGAPILNVISCEQSGKKFVDSFMKEKSIDLVIFYNMRVETSGIAIHVKKKYGVPIILEYEDGLERDANNNAIKRFIYRVVQTRVKKFLDGAILVNSLVKNRFDCDSVVIRGVSHDKGRAMTLPNGDEKIRVLFASSLDEQRGLQVVLESLQYTSMDFELYVTGKGPMEEVVSKCEDHRLHFMGYLEYEKYVDLLESAHICLCAQKSGQKYAEVSFPSKLFEFLSMNKMVVSSDVADVEDCLGNALLVYHNDDPKELAQKLEQACSVLRNAELAQEYEAEIKKALYCNSIESISEEFQKLVNSCEQNGRKK